MSQEGPASEVYQMTPEGDLIISSVRPEHQGEYSCVVQNTLGIRQATARLDIIGWSHCFIALFPLAGLHF